MQSEGDIGGKWPSSLYWPSRSSTGLSGPTPRSRRAFRNRHSSVSPPPTLRHLLLHRIHQSIIIVKAYASDRRVRASVSSWWQTLLSSLPRERSCKVMPFLSFEQHSQRQKDESKPDCLAIFVGLYKFQRTTRSHESLKINHTQTKRH